MNLSSRLMRIAAVYFMAGSMLGVIMGITQDFREAPVHAHLNLLGWASLGLISLIYRAHPSLMRTRLATMHFWLHNLGLPVGMIGLFFLLRGDTIARPLVAIGSLSVIAGIACFVINVMRSAPRDEERSSLPAGAVGNFFDA